VLEPAVVVNDEQDVGSNVDINGELNVEQAFAEVFRKKMQVPFFIISDKVKYNEHDDDDHHIAYLSCR
jgi:hypothetical protein